MSSSDGPMKNVMNFRLADPNSLIKFSPRLGFINLQRSTSNQIHIETPALTTSTSRGVVPHLSRDHIKTIQAIKWVHIPFESFLERVPPVPTVQGGPHALHSFLGFIPNQNVLSMLLRDPFDGRELPPNGKDYVNAHCVRGVRKVTPSSWRSHVLACNPDLVVALSDIPFSPPPFSQKRLTKSIERSTTWIASLLSPMTPDEISQNPDSHHPMNILVHMAGDTSLPARHAFAASLTETLHGKEAEQVKPFRTLDEGIFGYVFDLIPLRLSLLADDSAEKPLTNPQTSLLAPKTALLMKASLEDLPSTKLRIVNSAGSPHEMLALIRDIGIDLFDAHWAQKSADWGIALDFAFPVPQENTEAENIRGPRIREHGRRDLGHNLYDPLYAHDFVRFATCFSDGASSNFESSTVSTEPRLSCPCAACSPITPTDRIQHSSVDATPASDSRYEPPFTRAYVHHLLHTHEMSAHALLVMHNLAILDAFFAGVRRVIGSSSNGTKDVFEREVQRFYATYDENLTVFDEAKNNWIEVDFARGKGRLSRERAKQAEASLATEVESQVT